MFHVSFVVEATHRHIGFKYINIYIYIHIEQLDILRGE